ncbi:MAG TPA: TlpA disulfide reductase family protein [Chloroflexia bacterium]|nr:TlpA disulfide reductase family protein [Chloroflexia bacterium]
MSKQNPDKKVGGEKRADGTTRSTTARTQVTPKMADRTPVAGARPPRPAQTPDKRVGGVSSSAQTRQRSRTLPPQKKSSFEVRPLDLGLVVLGLIVVGLIVWSSLASNNSTPSNLGVSQVPTVAGAASVPTVANVPGGPTATLDPTFPKPIAIGEVAPDFALPSPDGKAYSLSQFKGKVVLLELFAPWCPHCQEDAPIFNEVYEKYKDQGVQVLAVSGSPWGHKLQEEQAAEQTPTPISMDDIIWFRDTYKVPFPMLFDKDLKAAEAYGLAFYPTVYVIGKDGKVASNPAGNYIFENGNPVSQREEPLSVEFLSRKLDEALK